VRAEVIPPLQRRSRQIAQSDSSGADYQPLIMVRLLDHQFGSGDDLAVAKVSDSFVGVPQLTQDRAGAS